MKKIMLFLVILMMIQLCACATQVTKKNRYVWPMLPEVPRIEWIRTFNSPDDLDDSGNY